MFQQLSFIIILVISTPSIAVLAKTKNLPCIVNSSVNTAHEIITELTKPCRYDKDKKPGNLLPITVQVNVNHLESTQQTQFTAYMTVQYRYNDSRLAYKYIFPSRRLLYGETVAHQLIWAPHLIISTGKDSNRLGTEKRDLFITISPEGNVICTQRISAVFYCWMSMAKFPFDRQACQLAWRSWSSNASSLVLKWEEDVPIQVSSNVHLTEFLLAKTVTFERIVAGPFATGPLAGNFSELVFEFHLHREIGYYVMCYFLPSVLLVCTSWVTFWLQADAGPPRAILGTSTVVAFITLNIGLIKDLPKNSSIKASDVWFLGISVFIVGSLIEFAFVNVIWRRKKQMEMVKTSSRNILASAIAPSLAKERVRKVPNSSISLKKNSFSNLGDNLRPPSYIELGNEIGELGTGSEEVLTTLWQTMSPQEVAIWLDRKARLVFPILFLLFNVFYWIFVYFL